MTKEQADILSEYLLNNTVLFPNKKEDNFTFNIDVLDDGRFIDTCYYILNEECDNITESYIIFNADTFNRKVLNKTFSIKIPDVWNERAYNGVKDNIKKDPENTTPWIYKPIKIRPTFRSYKTGWQHANLNIINYKWLTFEYPY